VSRAESKTHLLQRLDEEWPKFQALIESIPDVEMDRPGVVDQWCLKELLGHVNFWAEKAAHDVRVAAAGKPEEIEVPVGGQPMVDEWNAREAARGMAMTPAQLRAALLETYQDARRALEEAPEEALAPVVAGWSVGVRYAADTYSHYREHAEQIKLWARNLETTEA
jgi:hypothetical protein